MTKRGGSSSSPCPGSRDSFVDKYKYKSECRLRMARVVAAPISALCFSACANRLFVGMANTLRIYGVASSALLLVTEVLPRGETIHGVEVAACDTDLLLIFGLREARVVRCSISSRTVITVDLTYRLHFSARVLCMALVPSLLSVGCDDNTVVHARWGDKHVEPKAITCVEKPLLYTMALEHREGHCAHVILAVAGTAFRTALVWNASPLPSGSAAQHVAPQERPAMFRLAGHAGAIFRARFSPSGCYVGSASDDRRLVLWKLADPTTIGSPSASASTAVLNAELAWFAHGARVWDLAFIEETQDEPGGCSMVLASSGEDCAVKLWRASLGTMSADRAMVSSSERSELDEARSVSAVELLATLRGHAGKHVWCVAAHAGGHSGPFMLASGGADGAIKLWPLHRYGLQRGTVERPDTVAVEYPTIATTSSTAQRAPVQLMSSTSPRAAGGSMASIALDEGAPIRALALLDAEHALVATASGKVWAAEVGMPEMSAMPRLLYNEEDVRWSKLHVTRTTTAAALVLVGSASGDVALLRVEAPGVASSGSQVSAPPVCAMLLGRWKAHATCVMHFEWVGFSRVTPAMLVSADAKGLVVVWSVDFHAEAAHGELPASTEPVAGSVRQVGGPKRLLPASQRVSSLASGSRHGALPTCLIFCGGSAGALRAHNIEAQPAHSGASDGEASSIRQDDESLMQNAHAGQPVTHILVASAPRTSVGNTGQGTHAAISCFSCGRNGVVNEYVCCDASDDMTSAGRMRLTILRRWKCSEATILEALMPLASEGLAVLAFVQNEAIMWHVQSRQELARWATKGYRHPKDVMVRGATTEGADGSESCGKASFLFAYGSGNSVHSYLSGAKPPTLLTHEQRLHGSDRAHEIAVLELGRSLHHNFHGREALCIVPLLQTSSHRGHLAFFATGSEDNTIKIHSFGGQSACSDVGLAVEATLEGHPASVRALAISSTTGSIQNGVLFSVGGKEAIHAWLICSATGSDIASVDVGGESTLVRAVLLCTRVAPERNASANKRGGDGQLRGPARGEAEADSRYLSAAATPLLIPGVGVGHLLAVSTSQGHVDVFLLPSTDPLTAKLLPIGRLSCPAGPILSMCIHVISNAAPPVESNRGPNSAEAVFLCGGSTAGTLTVWDLMQLFDRWLEDGQVLLSAHGDRSTKVLVAAPPPADWLSPCCHVEQLHAMGINCMCMMQPRTSPASEEAHRFHLATGGDDEAIGLCELCAQVRLPLVAATGRKWTVEVVRQWLRRSVHTAGVRGIAALRGEWIISAGADSRVHALRVVPRNMADGGRALADDNSDGDAELSRGLEPCWSLAVSVEQLHGLSICDMAGVGAVAVVVGCGVEALPIDQYTSCGSGDSLERRA